MKLKFILIIIFSYNLSYANWTIIDSTQLSLDSYVRFFYLDINDNIWLGTASPGKIYKFDGIKTEYYDTTNTPLPFTQISCITQGPNGDMYFGTYEDNTFPTIEKKTCVIKFDGENWEYFNQHNSPLHPYTIWDILVTGDDEFWVATMIGLFHYKEGTWNSYFEDENDFRREIIKLSIDKNNNLYITNTLRELYSANLNNSNLKFNKINTPQLPVSSVVSIVDSLNNLWLYYRNNLAKKDGNNWIVYDSTYFDMNIPWGILISNNKKTYTNNYKAVYEYKENTYWEKIFDIPEELRNEKTTIILDNHSKRPRLVGVDSKGNFWFTPGINHGLLKYTPEQASVAQKSNVTLYPNPSQASITVSTEQAITSLALYSLSLSKIKDLTPNHTTTQEINLSTLPAGVYFIKVNDDFVKFVRE